MRGDLPMRLERAPARPPWSRTSCRCRTRAFSPASSRFCSFPRPASRPRRLAAARSLAPRAPAPSGFEPADSLEGNYLAAYIAGALRDTAAAASYYRETLKADPRNPELLERAFVSFLADGAMHDAFRLADRVVAARQRQRACASRARRAKHLKAKQYVTARAHLAKGGRGRAADLTATLLAAWAHAGAGDGKKALETVDKLKGERAYASSATIMPASSPSLVGNRPRPSGV